MTDSTLQFDPFANEADVLQIGDLTFENRLDRITMCGDLDLTLDQAGLADARALHQLLGRVLARLEREALPDRLPPQPPAAAVRNPFV